MKTCDKIKFMIDFSVNPGGNMNLKEYLFYKGMTVREFCKLAEFSDAFLSSVLSGKKVPSAKTLRIIEKATKGKVKAENVCAPITLPDDWEDDEEGGRMA
jgi:transcriptional regulator with XRE-family HTH domain